MTTQTTKNRRRSIGVTLLLVLLIGASGWLLGWSSFLNVKQIEVVGVAADSPLKSEVIIELSGVRIGEPMARLNGTSVKRELSQLSRVGSVSLIRKWPHRVVLVIKERVPVAAIVKGNQYQLVDKRSKEYALVSSVPVGVPTMKIDGDYPTGLKAAMSVITYLPLTIRSQVTQVESSGADSVRLTLQSGAKILWGSSEDLGLKSRVLVTLLAGVGANQVKTFDVSAPYAPTTK